MREFGKIMSQIWQSADFRALSEDGRTMLVYLLTCPHATLIGAWRLSDAYVADDLQWTLERVREGFAELIAKAFVTRDEASQWVFIHRFLKWNQFENPNVVKNAFKAFDKVPVVAVKLLLAKAFLDFAPHLSADHREGLETLLEPYRKPEPEPSLNQSLNQSPSQATAGADLRTPASGKGTPRGKPSRQVSDPKEESKSSVVWAYYADAYRDRYGAPPMRNAKVNGQLAQLITRIPADEAPQVADFYVRHAKNRLYVSAGHCVDLLLRDAEKLRTEWFTGRQMTSTEANQADRQQATASAFDDVLNEQRMREAEAGHAQ